MAGKLNVSVECSPLLGPQLMSAVKDIKAGKTGAQAHRHGGRHLPDGSRRQGIPEAQVLTTPVAHFGAPLKGHASDRQAGSTVSSRHRLAEAADLNDDEPIKT